MPNNDFLLRPKGFFGPRDRQHADSHRALLQRGVPLGCDLTGLPAQTLSNAQVLKRQPEAHPRTLLLPVPDKLVLGARLSLLTNFLPHALPDHATSDRRHFPSIRVQPLPIAYHNDRGPNGRLNRRFSVANFRWRPPLLAHCPAGPHAACVTEPAPAGPAGSQAPTCCTSASPAARPRTPAPHAA